MFLTLARLRLGLREEDLAYRFDISPSTVSRIFITWINLVYLRLGSLRIWPSRQEIKEKAPASFREKYPSVVCTIDATEITLLYTIVLSHEI
eukprot:m.270809 g.270809  ORF g.270809 m.270809 type:complete len:92 (+) comp40544_c2_seq26:1164-1439(+)